MQIIKSNPEAQVVDIVNTEPEKTPEDILGILKTMNPTALLKQFGTGTFSMKFIGIKAFMTANNIVSGNKYPPRLNYAHKHLINDIIIGSLPKKRQTQAISLIKKTLNHKINNLPKSLYGKTPSKAQLEHIKSAYTAELNKW
jgi:hypothetical protein